MLKFNLQDAERKMKPRITKYKNNKMNQRYAKLSTNNVMNIENRRKSGKASQNQLKLVKNY